MDDRQAPLQTDYLMTLDMEAMVGLEIGKTPRGYRRIDRIERGTFSGPKLSGKVVTATDHLLVLRDNSARPDVRLVLETTDGVLVQIMYQGIVWGPKEVLKKLGRREEVSGDQYYMRSAAFFETAMDNDYAWLNNVIAVGRGAVRILDGGAFGVRYDLFQVL
ncbi:MAG: DUF3237 domain-containing protein [Proteobacteria bacterium]|nr:DUF3237 domain-containing protein [Pseudomonadota bacterium]MDA1059268.1 DUF3237 domain-containing protein [Pseudomonadota bacterium]